jgi:hypothetical protein
MLIKRKTTESRATARGRVTFHAGHGTVLHAGAVAPKDAPDALLAPAHVIMAERCGDPPIICPDVTIKIPGIGEILLFPAEVHALEQAIAVARKQATVGVNFLGRELSRSF